MDYIKEFRKLIVNAKLYGPEINPKFQIDPITFDNVLRSIDHYNGRYFSNCFQQFNGIPIEIIRCEKKKNTIYSEKPNSNYYDHSANIASCFCIVFKNPRNGRVVYIDSSITDNDIFPCTP